LARSKSDGASVLWPFKEANGLLDAPQGVLNRFLLLAEPKVILDIETSLARASRSLDTSILSRKEKFEEALRVRREILSQSRKCLVQLSE
jgi:hypothetical protein